MTIRQFAVKITVGTSRVEQMVEAWAAAGLTGEDLRKVIAETVLINVALESK